MSVLIGMAVALAGMLLTATRGWGVWFVGVAMWCAGITYAANSVTGDALSALPTSALLANVAVLIGGAVAGGLVARMGWFEMSARIPPASSTPGTEKPRSFVAASARKPFRPTWGRGRFTTASRTRYSERRGGKVRIDYAD